MDINEATAKALQAARAVSGMTFDELSQKSGVSVQTIYRMFGAKRDIKVPQLYSLATAMGVTVVEIMEDAERIQKREERSQSSDIAAAAAAALADEEARIAETKRLAQSGVELAALDDPNKYNEMQEGEPA